LGREDVPFEVLTSGWQAPAVELYDERRAAECSRMASEEPSGEGKAIEPSLDAQPANGAGASHVETSSASNGDPPPDASAHSGGDEAPEANASPDTSEDGNEEREDAEESASSEAGAATAAGDKPKKKRKRRRKKKK